jgi:hypothetical protein
MKDVGIFTSRRLLPEKTVGISWWSSLWESVYHQSGKINRRCARMDADKIKEGTHHEGAKRFSLLPLLCLRAFAVIFFL